MRHSPFLLRRDNNGTKERKTPYIDFICKPSRDTVGYIRLSVRDKDSSGSVENQNLKIFEMAASGTGVTGIVRYLNERGLPTPIQYAKANGLDGNFDDGNGSWNSRSMKYILINRTYTGMLVQVREKRAIEATHELLVDSSTFDAIQKAFQARTYNVVPQGQSADNILKGKVICGCCGGKMQRKRGTGYADWLFFTCIAKNRLGADKCTGMYAREEDIFNAIYRQLKDYVNEHYITNSAYKQKIQGLTEKIANLAQRKTTVWINAMEHYEQ